MVNVMLWHLAAAAVAYLFCASAAADSAGHFVVEVREPLLTDPGSGRGTCCPEVPFSKVWIYQAVLHETVKFHVYSQVVGSTSTNIYTTILFRPLEKTECYSSSCRAGCWYSCEPKEKVSINGSECYTLDATSRSPYASANMSICVYNRSAEPLKVLHPPASYFDKGLMTLKYEIGGYPLPASINVTCNEQSDGGTAHQVEANISYVQEDVGYYVVLLNNVTAGELRCRVAAHSEFRNFTSETDLILVTSSYTMGTQQLISHEVTAVTTKAYASILLNSEPPASGPSKEVILGISTAAVASTVLVAIAVGVAMWRRNATRRMVTITNENHHTTIVNNDNRQTIVNNCQHNYVDMVNHSGIVDINDMLLAWDDVSPTSYIHQSMHDQCRRSHEESGCDDNFEGASRDQPLPRLMIVYAGNELQ